MTVSWRLYDANLHKRLDGNRTWSTKISLKDPSKVSCRHTYENCSRSGDIGDDIRGSRWIPLVSNFDQNNVAFPVLNKQVFSCFPKEEFKFVSRLWTEENSTITLMPVFFLFWPPWRSHVRAWARVANRFQVKKNVDFQICCQLITIMINFVELMFWLQFFKSIISLVFVCSLQGDHDS